MAEYYNEVLHKIKKTLRYESRLNCLHEYLPAHCFSVIELTENLAGKYNLNLDVVLAKNIAQNHDLGEYLKGDIDAGKICHGKVKLEDKMLYEKQAWDEIRKILPEELFKKKYGYWRMFEECEINEAKFARSIDNLEALFYMVKIGKDGFINKSAGNDCGMDEKDYDLSATYPDLSMKNFIKAMNNVSNPGNLAGYLNELALAKEKLKIIYKEVGAPWKKEYNYSLE